MNTTIPLYRGLLIDGDHLVFDKNTGKRMVIRHGDFDRATLPDNLVNGRMVFYGNMGDKAYFVGVEEIGSKAFSQYSRYKLTGFDLEKGNDAKIAATNFDCKFSYGANSTYADIAARMNEAKTGTYGSYVLIEALSDGIGIKTWPTDITVVSGGLAGAFLKAIKADGTEVDGKVSWDTLAHYCDLTAIGYNAMDMMGKDGIGRLHKKQYIEYIRTLGSATTFGDEYTAFMNQATFKSCADGTVGGADGIALYNKYNGDYNAYANVCADLRKINYDAQYKTAETLRDGEKATNELAAVKMYDFDGSIIDAFPAPAAAKAYGITTAGFVTGFEPGNWHEIGVGELARIMRKATSRTTTLDANDVINAAIVADNGTPIVGSNSYALCGAGDAGSQLVFYGSYGILSSYYSRIGTLKVRVSRAFDYDDL